MDKPYFPARRASGKPGKERKLAEETDWHWEAFQNDSENFQPGGDPVYGPDDDVFDIDYYIKAEGIEDDNPRLAERLRKKYADWIDESIAQSKEDEKKDREDFREAGKEPEKGWFSSIFGK